MNRIPNETNDKQLKTLKDKIKIVRDMEGIKRDHMKTLYERPSHKKRMGLINKVLKENIKRNNSFLEIGCAEGIYCNNAKQYGYKRVVGIDISKIKIAKANKLFKECQFYCSDCEDLSEFYNQFDFLLCTEVLQHVIDYNHLVNEMLKCLTQRGLFLISIPNLSSSENNEFAKINARMTHEELLNEIGGAGFGKQNAVWKFNSNTFCLELSNKFSIELKKIIPVDTDDGLKRNLWSILLFKKN